MNKSEFSAEGMNDLVDRLYAAPVERRVLSNGLTLLHRPDYSSDVVSVQVWVKTGSIHEGDLVGSGLSHYLEHLLFKGTDRRDGKSISREVHALGGGINAYTTFDRTVYYIDAPAAAFEQAVDILADITLHSTLPADEVERERDVILREIDMGLDDPDRVMSQLLFRSAFRTHPYREPVIGHRELFEQVTREELWSYYQQRYVPNNIVFASAGAISAEACVRAVEATFGQVARGRLAPVVMNSEPAQLAPRYETLVGDYQIYRGGMSYKVPHLSHEDSASLDALANALGGGESSLLWESLRNEQQLVHYIDCRSWNPGEEGLFWISYMCDAEQQSKVQPAIRAVIDGLIADGVSTAVVEKSRRQALSAEINGRKTMSGQASRLGLSEVVVGDVEFGRRYLSRLESVGPEDLQRVAAKYLVERQLTSVGLGPNVTVEGEGKGCASTVAKPEAPEVIAVENGARLILQPDASLPKVHLRAVFLAGPMYEPANQRGITELLAELLTKDTENRTAYAVSELIEGIGGKFSSSGGNNTLSLAIEVLPTDLDCAVDVLADALTCPLFDAHTFEVEREGQVAGLREDADDILEYGFKELRSRYFKGHALSVGSDGRIEDLEALTPADVRRYYEQVVVAGNLVLSVCGDFVAGELEPMLRVRLFDKLSTRAFERDSAAAYKREEVCEDVVLPMDREQAVVLQAYPDVGVQDARYVEGEVLNELLSGMSSRLFERVRDDKGLAYYVGATRVLGLTSSLFALYAGTQPGCDEAVMGEMDAELERISSGRLDPVELERCKTRLRAARVMGRQTIGARAMHAAINVSYGFPVDDDVQYLEKLDVIDVRRIAQFVQDYLKRSQSIRLVVKPSLDVQT